MLPQSRSLRPSRYVGTVLAVALAGSAVLAGCGAGGASDDASASVDPYGVAASVRASASAEASGGASAGATTSLSPEDAALRATALAMEAPEKPAAMSENTPEGAVAAAEYFISLYPYVYATGDLTEWDAMSEDSCVFCQSVHDKVTELHQGGGWADPWGQTTDVAYVGQDPNDSSTMAVKLIVNGTERTSHEQSGNASSAPKDNGVLVVQVHWSGRSWVIQKGRTE